jgi:hypothetical protein
MSLRSFLTLLVIAPIAVCGAAATSWAQAGARKWPDQAQLKRQMERCHLSKPPEGIPANEARAATLDYETQCYRQLADIEHAKRSALQDAVSRNRTRKMPDQTLLKREPLPDCRLSKPPDAVPESEARVATLEHENQCYRQLAETEHGKLDALQQATRHMGRSSSLMHPIHHRRLPWRQSFTTYFQGTR